MKVSIKRVDYRLLIVMAILLAVLGFSISIMPVQSSPVPAIIMDREVFGTGLLEGTAVQDDWMRSNVPVAEGVRMNALALQRLNQDRASRGLPAITATDTDVVGAGEELDYSGSSEPLGDDMLPGSIDNSKTIYFPPIRSQGSLGSCVAWSTTYYAFTYEINFAMGRTANTGDNNMIFSPKWTYNMINYGSNSGAYFSDAFYLLTKHGAVTWADFPYDSNYLQWCLDPTAWRDAINYRASGWSQIYNSDTSALIIELKTHLANGHVMVIGTYVSSWVSTYIKNDNSTNADDAFVNQRIATYMKNTRSGGHGMTLVGYNDEIWCDLNGNGKVDSGEKGAFKIANSWGTGDWNSGFRWVAYDAVYGASQVVSAGGWPTSDRDSRGIFRGGDIYTLSVRSSYTPKVVAEFTINHIKRGQLSMTLGTGSTAYTTPSLSWSAEAIYGSGGNYAFDGTTLAKDGTFVFDFTDIAPTATGVTRWFVGMRDNTAGDTATIKSFKLYQVTESGDVLVGTSTVVPKTADYTQSYVWVDYQYNSNNSPPTALIGASPSSGVAPLAVLFDGRSSYDLDGSVVSYRWSFGDGYVASGQTASHTYSNAGSYTVTLTVTDDDGAQGTASKTITVTTAANNPPDAAVSTNTTNGYAPLAVGFNGSSSKDADGSIVSYSWSFGDGWSGTGSTVTHAYASAGSYMATLTVKDNMGATDSASVQITVSATPANVAPTAMIKTNSTGGAAPLVVAFDGSASSDPDGSIVSYQWNFGDGKTGTGISAVHYYGSAGTYTVVLTVTDGNGATGTASVVITVSKAPEILNAPSNLVASLSFGKVILTWADNSNIESGFYIERATKIPGRPLSFTVIGKVSANSVSFTDAPPRGTYTYRICAYNADGVSPYSNSVLIRVK